MARFDFSRRIAESMLFKDYDCLAQQSAAVFEALEKLPAYRLLYGSDPAEAVPLVLRMFADDDGQKPQIRAKALMTKI
jgi:predicted TIM-barrel fold metal-dependent hydrolase